MKILFLIYLLKLFDDTTILLIGIAVLMVAFVVTHFRFNRSEDEEIMIPTEETNRYQYSEEKSNKQCRKLCCNTLKKLNCEVSVNPNDENWFDFNFQGANFAISCTPNFLRIWYPFFYEIDTEDLDRLAHAQRIMNKINGNNCTPSIFYVINKENRKMYIHAAMDTIFVEQIPQLHDFLAGCFHRIFVVANEFLVQMQSFETQMQQAEATETPIDTD